MSLPLDFRFGVYNEWSGFYCFFLIERLSKFQLKGMHTIMFQSHTVFEWLINSFLSTWILYESLGFSAMFCIGVENVVKNIRSADFIPKKKRRKKKKWNNRLYCKSMSKWKMENASSRSHRNFQFNDECFVVLIIAISTLIAHIFQVLCGLLALCVFEDEHWLKKWSTKCACWG